MRAHSVSSVFCICPKTPFSIFTSQKSSRILREYVCRPLSNGCQIDKNNSVIYRNIQHMFLNLIISKFSTQYH